MRTVVLYAIFVVVTLPSVIAQPAGIRLGDPRPSQGTAVLRITPMPGQVPNSLREMSK